MPLFVKGQSGNPIGRPKATHREKIKALARKHTKEAVRILESIMNDPAEPGRTRIAAAEALLDRGYGRPAQALEAQDAKGNAVTLGVVIVPAKHAPSEDEKLYGGTAGGGMIVPAEPAPSEDDSAEGPAIQH